MLISTIQMSGHLLNGFFIQAIFGEKDKYPRPHKANDLVGTGKRATQNHCDVIQSECHGGAISSTYSRSTQSGVSEEEMTFEWVLKDTEDLQFT